MNPTEIINAAMQKLARSKKIKYLPYKEIGPRYRDLAKVVPFTDEHDIPLDAYRRLPGHPAGRGK